VEDLAFNTHVNLVSHVLYGLKIEEVLNRLLLMNLEDALLLASIHYNRAHFKDGLL
jgi:hypothetical protein